MSKICRYNVNKENLEITLKCIDRMLSVASHYNGKFFGGYVRDVVVPRTKDPNCDVSFKDVDIWFTNGKDAESFVDVMKITEKMYGFKDPFLNTSPKYKFKRTQYCVPNKACSFFIDVVVSKDFPVNDFDVNFLTYYVADGIKKLKTMGFNDIDCLVESIHKKEARMLISYAEVLKPENKLSYGYAVRFNDRYIGRGWTIIYDDIRITTPILSNFSDHLVGLKAKAKEVKKEETTLPKETTLDKFIKADNLLKEAVLNRNKAFYDCIVDLKITDKEFISSNLADYRANTSNGLYKFKILTTKI
jgi:hypothetical protein